MKTAGLTSFTQLPLTGLERSLLADPTSPRIWNVESLEKH